MVFFIRTPDNHIKVDKERYAPVFIMEIMKIRSEFTTTFIECVTTENWDLIFLIMMAECPEEVKVVMELREHTLHSIYGYNQPPTIQDLQHEFISRHLIS